MKKFSPTETIIIITLVMAVLTGVLWLGLRQAREMRKRELDKGYEQGWDGGWRNHTDYDLCLLAGKAALMQAGGGKMLDCVPKEEAKGTTHDVLIDELP